MADTECNTAELHAAVLDGGGAGMDVVISSAMDLQVDLVNCGLARAFRPLDAEAPPEWASWRDELWGFAFEPVVTACNRAAFEGLSLPRTRAELASQVRDDPAFHDRRVGAYDAPVSGAGYFLATQDARRPRPSDLSRPDEAGPVPDGLVGVVRTLPGPDTVASPGKASWTPTPEVRRSGRASAAGADARTGSERPTARDRASHPARSRDGRAAAQSAHSAFASSNSASRSRTASS
ncbi:MAG: hypothetical protein ACFCUS_07190 [Rubrimonas sp.]